MQTKPRRPAGDLRICLPPLPLRLSSETLLLGRDGQGGTGRTEEGGYGTASCNYGRLSAGWQMWWVLRT